MSGERYVKGREQNAVVSRCRALAAWRSMAPTSRIGAGALCLFMPLLSAAQGSFLADTAMSDTAAMPCDIAGIASGFGSQGPWAVAVDSIASPLWERQQVYLFSPLHRDEPSPLVVLCHTYGSVFPDEYDLLIRNLVSRGYAVVYPPVRRVTFTRKQLFKYRMAFEGVDTVVKAFGARLDTTRLGIVGHGFGAGMAPSLARQLIERQGWGSKGAFMFLMAPWYVYGIDQRGLRSFPSHVKLVVQVYEDDRTNDPRIAADLFDNIGIPSSEKDFMILRSDRRRGCRLRAGNEAPLSDKAFAGENNALDYYGVLRTVDALAAYAFEGDRNAKPVALGEGSSHQVYMGTWPDGTPVKPATVTDVPQSFVGKGVYANSWKSPRNPRVDANLFRRARKLFVSHWRRKIRALAQTLAGRSKAKEFEAADKVELVGNPILSGYGAAGPHTWTVDSFPNSLDPEVTVHVFLPDSVAGRPPVLFLVPGYSGGDPRLFDPFLSHVVSTGIAVIHSPFPILPAVSDAGGVLDKLEIVRAGFRQAMRRHAAALDTARAGFMGQSFGGGLTPAIAYQTITGDGWGREGAFMFLTAPWYCFDMNDERLRGFPSHVKLVVQVYDEDQVNDHQMAVDLFTTIGIDPRDKDYVLVHSDSFVGVELHASHFVPYGPANIHGTEDLLDYHAVCRLVDALADCAFRGSEEGRAVALGNGAAAQCTMGEWQEGRPVRRLEVTDEPRAYLSQMGYLWAWDNRINPRRERSRFETAR